MIAHFSLRHRQFVVEAAQAIGTLTHVTSKETHGRSFEREIAGGGSKTLTRETLIKRRSEVAVILSTVVVLALLFSLAANLLFAVMYPIHRTALLIAIPTCLLIALLMFFLFLFARREIATTTVKFLYVFDRRTPKFIQIPGAPASVHIRIHFEQLSPERQREFAEQDDIRTLLHSEFSSFINQSTEAMLLFFLFGNSPVPDSSMQALSLSELPKSIRKNPCLIRDHERNENILYRFPKWATLEEHPESDYGIRIKTPVGFLDLTWDIFWTSTAHLTEPYLTATQQSRRFDTHEMGAEVTLRYNCKFLRLHSRILDEYIDWVMQLTAELEELDWESTRDFLSLEILRAIAARLPARQP